MSIFITPPRILAARACSGIIGPAAAWLAFAFLACPALRADGVRARTESAETLTFGMSTVLSGLAADLGQNMKAGINVAFAEANAAGGIRGQKLLLVALDDGYEPARAAPNVRKLIDEHRVLGLIGNVGTPTAVAAIPIAREEKVPYLFPYSGAGIMRRTPPDRVVFNYRASYAEEVDAMVAALVNHGGIKPEEIAFFSQRDAYGDSGYQGGIAALKRLGLKHEWQVAHGRVERNSFAVEGALADILVHKPAPRAVIMIGAYRPCARFIQLARAAKLDAEFLNVSFVGGESLAATLRDEGEGVIVTQVVPHYGEDLPICGEFRAAWQKFAGDAQPTLGALEGYLGARILLKALRSIEGEITRDSILKAMEGLGEFEIGLGRPLRFTPQRHQASNYVWPTVIRAGRITPMDWRDLTPMARRPAP